MFGVMPRSMGGVTWSPGLLPFEHAPTPMQVPVRIANRGTIPTIVGALRPRKTEEIRNMSGIETSLRSCTATDVPEDSALDGVGCTPTRARLSRDPAEPARTVNARRPRDRRSSLPAPSSTGDRTLHRAQPSTGRRGQSGAGRPRVPGEQPGGPEDSGCPGAAVDRIVEDRVVGGEHRAIELASERRDGDRLRRDPRQRLHSLAGQPKGTCQLVSTGARVAVELGVSEAVTRR